MVSALLEPQAATGMLHLQKLRSGTIYFLLWPTQVAVGESKPHSLPSASNLHTPSLPSVPLVISLPATAFSRPLAAKGPA